MKVSKCCGHPIPDDMVLAMFSPMQQRILRALRTAGSAGLPAQDLRDVVYQDDIDGGPLNTDAIKVAICHMRPRLREHALTIVSDRGGQGSRYYLRGTENAVNR